MNHGFVTLAAVGVVGTLVLGVLYGTVIDDAHLPAKGPRMGPLYSFLIVYAYVVAVSVSYNMGLLRFLLTPRHDNGMPEPIRLANVSFWWAVVTFVAFLATRLTIADPDRVVKNTRGFFSVGYSDNLSIFDIYIDTYYGYALVLIYQITRAVLGTLLGQFYGPWLTNEVQSHEAGMKGDSRAAVQSRMLQIIFSWWSGITDIFFAMSQIDITITVLVTMLITEYMCMDRWLTNRAAPPREKAVQGTDQELEVLVYVSRDVRGVGQKKPSKRAVGLNL